MTESLHMRAELSGPELGYPAHDKELLAVVHGFRVFRHYLHGRPFTVITDNSATTHIQTKTKLSAREARWLQELSDFNYTVQHRPGAINTVPDALSRRPDHKQAQPESARREPMQHACSALTLTTGQPQPFLQRCAAAAAKDPLYSEHMRRAQLPNAKSDFQQRGDLLVKNDRLYIPNDRSLQFELLQEAHDSPVGGHLGADKTLDRLKRSFYWPGMQGMVREYTRTCHTCQACKSDMRKAKGLLQSNPVPEHPWDSVSCDFITGLPRTARGHDAILMIVDRATKWMACEPTTLKVTAEEVANLFHKAIFRYHGVPRVIISDRDKTFTSKFWDSFNKLLGTRLNMSTANHPQTDGQSERHNRTLEDMLRGFVAPNQDDWDLRLVNAEFAYNDSVNATTGYSPFQLNFGRDPRTPLHTLAAPVVPEGTHETAQQFVARIREDRARAAQLMRQAQERQAAYYNKHRHDEVFTVGDKVMLSADHVRTPDTAGAKPKLQHRFLGPFSIRQVISPVAYKLDLPPDFAGVHPVFNISFLKRYRDGQATFPGRAEYQPEPTPDIIDDEKHFQVDKFIGHRYKYTQLMFTVRWKGNQVLNPPSEVPAWQLKVDMPEHYQLLKKQYIDMKRRTGSRFLPGPEVVSRKDLHKYKPTKTVRFS